MRYIVILAHPFVSGDVPSLVDIDQVVICKDAIEVQAAIDSNRKNRGGDWRVFELTAGKFEDRSVRFERDGRTVRSIQ